MRSRRFIFWLTIFIIGSLLAISCTLKWLGTNSWQPPKVVAVRGPELCMAYPPYYPLIFVPVQEKQPIHLPLRDGDLVFSSPNDCLFLYRNSDEHLLSVACDEAHVRLNGKTVSLNLDEDAAWQWLEQATSDDLDALRLVLISGEIDEKQVGLLKKLSERNAYLDMLIMENTNWQQVLPLFDPEWLGIEVAVLKAEDRAMLSAKKRLRNLWIDGGSDISFLLQLKDFETLWISEWDPEKTGPLPKNLKSLKHLHLLSPNMKDLTPLAEQPNLEELSLSTSTVDDLSRLADFPQLKVLNIAGCEDLRDLTPLKKLRKLKWLSLPPTTTQQQLAQIVHDHPDLIGLDLLGTENILDLSLLKNLRHLEFLSVSISEAQAGPLFEMHKLKWLAIYAEEGDKKKEKAESVGDDLVVKLEKTMPATAIVRLTPLCLGSGWILLLVPTVGLAWLLEKWRNGHGFAADKRDARG